MSAPAQQYLAWAMQALHAYDLQPTNIRFLGHSENITFQVSGGSANATWLLRLHHPKTATFEGIRQQPHVIYSELSWLDALAHDTSITVPTPIRNHQRGWVTQLSLADGKRLACTMLTWVHGEPFLVDGPTATTNAARLGRVLTGLHQQARTWLQPADFIRPSYDLGFFQQVAHQLEAGLGIGVIAPTDYQVIQQTIATICEEIEAIPQTQACWGIIHNDLHPGNCLVSGDEVCPIDFSLCGLGYYLFDLATSLGSLPVPLRPALLNAYQTHQTLPNIRIRLLEAFFILSRMSYYGFVLPDTAQHTWLQRRIPEVVATICRPFLHQQSFLFVVR